MILEKIKSVRAPALILSISPACFENNLGSERVISEINKGYSCPRYK